MKTIWMHQNHRSYFGKYKGRLSDVRADDLVASLLNQPMNSRPEAVVLGCANQAGEDARNIARLSVLLSTLPETTPAVTLNSLCGSSLHALDYAYLQLKTGRYQSLWAGGVEQMTRSPLVRLPSHIQRDAPWQDSTFGWRFTHPDFQERAAGRSMLQHAESLARLAGLNRSDLDAYTLMAQQRYAQYVTQWAEEAVPVRDLQGNPLLDYDEVARPYLSMKHLERLSPLLEGGLHTPAHVAPYADGAVGMLISTEKKAFATLKSDSPFAIEIVDLLILATAPEDMPLAGLKALEQLAQRHGLALQDVACFEYHETFASAHVLQCRALGQEALTDSRINRWGGALAVGSPMGATALRSVGTLAHRLLQEGTSQHPYGLASMSVGMGLGMAVLLKRHAL
jgi:acetyl-CoA acyltransferase